MLHSRVRCFRLTMIVLLGITLLGAFGVPQVARAVEFDDDGIIAADEMIDDDVFVSAEVIVVDGTVNGALIGSGKSITINGNVNGDLLMTGVDVTVNGKVNGNIAFIGKSLSVNGRVLGTVFFMGNSLTLEPSAIVGRNIFFNGFSLETQAGSMIGRDAIVSGLHALFAGRVDRDIQAQVSGLEIEGFVGRDVLAEVAAPENSTETFTWPGTRVTADAGLRVKEQAQIDGMLIYVSPVEQADAIDAVPDGGVFYSPPEETKAHPNFGHQVGQWSLMRLRDLITLLLLGSLAVWKYPVLMGRLADQVQSRALPAIGWGVMTLIGGNVVAISLVGTIIVLGIVVSVVTLGGLAFIIFGVGLSGMALGFALFVLAVVYGSKLIVTYTIGRSILQRFVPSLADKAIWSLVLGVVLYVMLRSIPVLGWWIGALMTLIGLGAMWMLFREKHRAPEAAQQ